VSQKLTPGQCPASDGFATDEWIPHDRSVAWVGASVTSAAEREANFTLGREREAGFTFGQAN
jgi:hypothetical protein